MSYMTKDITNEGQVHTFLHSKVGKTLPVLKRVFFFEIIIKEIFMICWPKRITKWIQKRMK